MKCFPFYTITVRLPRSPLSNTLPCLSMPALRHRSVLHHSVPQQPASHLVLSSHTPLASTPISSYKQLSRHSSRSSHLRRRRSGGWLLRLIGRHRRGKGWNLQGERRILTRCRRINGPGKGSVNRSGRVASARRKRRCALSDQFFFHDHMFRTHPFPPRLALSSPLCLFHCLTHTIFCSQVASKTTPTIGNTAVTINNPSVVIFAEASRSFHQFKELSQSKKKKTGRKRKHWATDAQRFNWIHPIVFQQIDNVTREVGPQMRSKVMVNLLHARNPLVLPRMFWAAGLDARKTLLQRGRRRFYSECRWAISHMAWLHVAGSWCVCGCFEVFPCLIIVIVTFPLPSVNVPGRRRSHRQVTYLQYLRTAGIPVDLNTVRAIMLAITEHRAPHLFQATVGTDKRPFLCFETFVRHFICEPLRWFLRMSTRAAQKTLVDAEQQTYEPFRRLALLVRDAGIRHPSLIIDFDQTQVAMANNTARTLDVEGSKQERRRSGRSRR